MDASFDTPCESNEHGKYRWMRGDQIDKEFPPAIAKAYKETLKRDESTFKPNPQLPDCEAAAMYKVMVEMEEDWSNVQRNEKKRKLTVDTSSGGDAALTLANWSDFDCNASSTTAGVHM